MPPPHANGCERCSGGSPLPRQWVGIAARPRPITPPSPPTRRRHLGGGDVATPKPKIPQREEGEGDVCAAVLPLGSSSPVFGDDVAMQLNGELQWRSMGR